MAPPLLTFPVPARQHRSTRSKTPAVPLAHTSPREKDCGGRWLHKGHITQDVLAKSKFRSDSGEACDSHGTHTASTAAGRLYGVAKEADIVVVQGLDCNGTASNSMFIAALDWAVDDAKKRGRPAVMTMSLGGD